MFKLSSFAPPLLKKRKAYFIVSINFCMGGSFSINLFVVEGAGFKTATSNVEVDTDW